MSWMITRSAPRSEWQPLPISIAARAPSAPSPRKSAFLGALPALLALILVMLLVLAPGLANAQTAATEADPAEELLDEPQTLRVYSADDYPPFNYMDEDGVLTGFNIDVARAICLHLDLNCDIQVRDWDDLLPALASGDTDIVIASFAMTPETVVQADFTDPYYFTPARFAIRRNMEASEPTPIGLEGERIAVVADTAHEAYLRRYYQDSIITSYRTEAEARDALKSRDANYLFGDAITLAFWLNGTTSEACCEFRGAALADPVYFGPGVSIAVRRGNTVLRHDLNRAIADLRATGSFEELFLRYFPLRVYD
ncbi:MAG: transporter substrate-binding domain-containing protein [Rhizobiales bacterium]|nr:transporter substrate-binding domain-containing protein [Hyphomicrobiales bacterium]